MVHESDTPHEADVVVFGAGPAGIAAAVTAARESLRVTLVEVQDRIGGVMASCPGMMLGSGYPCGTSVGGFFEEFVGRLYDNDPPLAERRSCGLANFGDEVVYDTEHAISLLYDLLSEAGVRLVVNHMPHKVVVSDGRVDRVEVVTTQGSKDYVARIWIDCTGNGDVAAKAGVPSQTGDAEGLTMGVSLTFFLANVDWARAFTVGDDPYYTDYASRGIAEGRLHSTLAQIYMLRGFREGTVFFNTVTVPGVDGTSGAGVAMATQTARRRVMELARFCREEMPGFENSYLTGVGPAVGVRETRRLEGLYTLTYGDVAGATKYEDGVVACDSPLDEVFRDEQNPLYSHEAALAVGDYYTIPFRTLVPRQVRNLLFAGRMRSVDGRAFASGRGIPQCMVMGQSAGIGAAMAITDACSVQQIDSARLVDKLTALGVNGIGGRPL